MLSTRRVHRSPKSQSHTSGAAERHQDSHRNDSNRGRLSQIITIIILSLALEGCVAWDVATLPVKATSKVVDWTTTSQDEADRNAGRKMRKTAERGRQAADPCGHRSGDCRGADGVPLYFERVEQPQ